MVEIDYNELNTEIEVIFKKNKEIVFSTCLENNVTSRTMSYIYMDQCFYFLTHDKSIKFKQIQKNPQVALCLNNIQIAGYAHIKGHPLIDSNKIICEAFKESHREFFERFVHFKNAIFVEVKISDIKVWKKEDKKDHFYCLDISKKRAFRK